MGCTFNWEPKNDSGSIFICFRREDITAIGLDNGLRLQQADAGAAALFLLFDRSFKQMFQHMVWNARTCILDRNDDPLALTLTDDVYLFDGGGVAVHGLNCVF